MYRPKKDGRRKAVRMGMKSTAKPEYALGSTYRSKIGVPKPSELMGPLFEGMVEEEETNYLMEDSFLEHSEDVQRIIDGMEKRDDKNEI